MRRGRVTKQFILEHGQPSVVQEGTRGEWSLFLAGVPSAGEVWTLSRDRYTTCRSHGDSWRFAWHFSLTGCRT